MLDHVMKATAISVAYAGLGLLLILIIASLVSFFTGNASRGYPTLARSASVVFAGQPVSLEQLARTFKPKFFLRPGDSSPPALAMWWEAIEAGDSIALVYHPVWEDERHPVRIVHWAYYLYRVILYGTPVRDIEYIQININRLDGSIQRIRFEDSTARSFDDFANAHVLVRIDRLGTQYIKTASFPNNTTSVAAVQIKGPHLRFGIATWSHQFTLLTQTGNSEHYTVPIAMPLEYLTEENYRKYKLARRSQGDFATRGGAAGAVAKMVIGTLILGVTYLLWQSFHNRVGRKSLHHGSQPSQPSRETSTLQEELHYTPSVRCPYCDRKFKIEDVTQADGSRGKPQTEDSENVELRVFPYARDVDIFDPLLGKQNSAWSRVGKDFYSVLSWDQFLGILQVEPGLQIYYCVARCSNCGKLMDVFVNLTKRIRTLSEIWPQLLKTDETGKIQLYKPCDALSRISANKALLFLSLIMIYSSAIIPIYLEQAEPGLSQFVAHNFSALLVRAIIIMALFFLLLLRQKYMKLFQNEDDFKTLFKVKDREGLVYWLNYAMSRFTGYQKGNRLFTLNGVVLLGGISSSIALVAAWALLKSGVLPGTSFHGPYATYAELMFWPIVAYCTGIAVWNFSNWLNYAVSRITGYQKGNRLFTLNGVVLLGGISSSTALVAAWALLKSGVLPGTSFHGPYTTYAELMFG